MTTALKFLAALLLFVVGTSVLLFSQYDQVQRLPTTKKQAVGFEVARFTFLASYVRTADCHFLSNISPNAAQRLDAERHMVSEELKRTPRSDPLQKELNILNAERTDALLAIQEVQQLNDVLYVVLTGKRSHRYRVLGIYLTLQRHRCVRWYSDSTDETHTIFPIVLNSSFEDRVCALRLVEETQKKGCRYQRNFYRVLHMLEDLALVLKQQQQFRWIVKISDDTMVIPQHLELQLAEAERLHGDPTSISLVLGRNESREKYWFFSGGHPIVFSRAAIFQWNRRVSCEGEIIDRGASYLRKFMWWADDVLTSYCMQNSDFKVVSLHGCISARTFSELPPFLGTMKKVNHTVYVFATNGTRKAFKRLVVSEVPVSFHAYPYITPMQMVQSFSHYQK